MRSPPSLPLRPFQEAALRALREKVHLLCIAATGSGKSRIYEEIARREGERLLLITPLVALARQQKSAMESRGIPVTLATAGLSEPPPRRSGVWIASPESLRNPFRQRLLWNWKPTLLVVDECHCLWEWGEGFRPAFRELPELLASHRIERSLWLTATLPPDARRELRSRIPLVEQGAFSLPSTLRLEAHQVPWARRASALLDSVTALPGPGIIFVGRRDSTWRIQRLLDGAGRRSIIYHAGLSAEERQLAEGRIRKQGSEVVIATSAFGMGMDHAHLGWVALWQAPPSLLSLAQAIGRAGRGSESSAATLAQIFWDDEDFQLLEWTLQGSERKREDLHAVSRFLRLGRCRNRALIRHFEPEMDAPECGRCDHCNFFKKPFRQFV